MNYRAVLLTDLDNTLYSWIDYFAPSFRAMVQALERATKFSKDEIFRQFRDVYRRFKAAEHPRAVLELELCRDLDPVVREELAKIGEAAFTQARRRHLRPYPNVAATLARLRNDNVVVIGITNASVYDAVTRIDLLGLAALFDGLVAWEGIAGFRPVADGGLLDRVVSVPTALLKPSSHPYRMAMELCGERPGVPIWVVGDSIANDLVPARDLGATTVWAKYGHEYDRENFDTVMQVTFWDENRIKSAYDASILEFDRTISDFGQLCELICGASSGFGMSDS